MNLLLITQLLLIRIYKQLILLRRSRILSNNTYEGNFTIYEKRKKNTQILSTLLLVKIAAFEF